MKKIELTQNQFALIDDEYYNKISQHKYFANKIGNTYYAARDIVINQKIKRIWMHGEIMKNQLKENEEVHHINGNGLDNREKNLMVVTKSQHRMIRGKQKTKASSKYKGVCWHKQHKKWVVQIMSNRKCIYLEYFNNEIDAAKAYDKKAKELFGEFARLNFKE